MSDDNQEFDDTEADDYISKSQRKRDMQAVQELGEKLTALTASQLEKFSLPENLHNAITAARGIQQHGARKRQLQYIGKLMRDIDPAPVQQRLDTLLGQSLQATQLLHNAERWRDQLLSSGDEALEALLAEHPAADRQQLRQLIRNAGKEQQENKPPRSARTLFRYLRGILQGD